MKLSELKIEHLKPTDLKLAPYNPRQFNPELFEQLKNNLTEFGCVEPVVVNFDQTVIGGNHRVMAAIELKWKTIPCVRVELDKKKEMILNISLNKIHGDWDIPKLKDVWAELDTGEWDMSFTGFEDNEIKELFDWERVELDEPKNPSETKPKTECPKCGFKF